MAWRTALRESRPKTAGWLIHSRAESRSASRAVIAWPSTAAAAGTEVVVTVAGSDGEDDEVVSGKLEDLGELGVGVSPRLVMSGPARAVDEGGGSGGRPPLPSPLRILRVSAKRCCARSCCPRETSVRDRVNMSDVSSSMRRCTIDGCGGIGGVAGRPDPFAFGFAGSIVMASSDGRGECVKWPSRSRSP